MSLPPKGTRGRELLEYLAKVDKKQIEGIITDLSDSMTRKSVRAGIAQMYDRGHVINLSVQDLNEDRRTMFSDIVALSESTRYELEDEQEAEEIAKAPVQIVQPRTVNVLTSPPLDKSRYLNPHGTREGSDWSRDVFKSRQL